MGGISILQSDTKENLLRLSSLEEVLLLNRLSNLTCLLSDSVEAVGVGDGAAEVPGMSCLDDALAAELARRPRLHERMSMGVTNYNKISHLQPL